jgi:hypothetical protein
LANQNHDETGTREATSALQVFERLVTAETENIRHLQQYGTSIAVCRSRKLHARLIVQDSSDVWVMGGPLTMKDNKARYLLPLTPGVAETFRDPYSDIWNQSNSVT